MVRSGHGLSVHWFFSYLLRFQQTHKKDVFVQFGKTNFQGEEIQSFVGCSIGQNPL